jgi:hypothetical protein
MRIAIENGMKNPRKMGVFLFFCRERLQFEKKDADNPLSHTLAGYFAHAHANASKK